MLILGLHLLVILLALSWAALDNNAVAAFEPFKRHLHSTARDMGMYWKWLVPSLLRAAMLMTLVIAGIVTASWMLQQNPWGLGWLGRVTLHAAMLTCSIAIFAIPHLSAQLRFKCFLKCKASELTKLVSIVSSTDGVSQHLEPAEMDAFDGVNGWTAWHPRKQWWNGEPLWAGLVPVIYLKQDTETSLIIPVIDFEHFLAWRLPGGCATPGNVMPIYPRCRVKAVGELRGREGWSVVHADLDLEDEAA